MYNSGYICCTLQPYSIQYSRQSLDIREFKNRFLGFKHPTLSTLKVGNHDIYSKTIFSKTNFSHSLIQTTPFSSLLDIQRTSLIDVDHVWSLLNHFFSLQLCFIIYYTLGNISPGGRECNIRITVNKYLILVCAEYLLWEIIIS